jgi:hypothetical protein
MDAAMNPARWNRRLALGVFGLASLGLVVWTLARPSSYVQASTGQITDVQTALAAAGIDFAPVSPADFSARSATQVSASGAVAIAVKQFGQTTVPVLYEGLVTAPDIGLQARPMYLVQLAGQEIFPHRPRPISTFTYPPVSIHEELLVFVDGNTGDMVFATTVR